MSKTQVTEEISVKVHISEISFNDGTVLHLNKNDLVIFVGPNNVGKSQALNDIYSKCISDIKTVVVQDIKIKKEKGSLLPLIKRASFLDDLGNQYHWYLNGVKYGFSKKNSDAQFLESSNYTSYRELFVCHLTTEKRLDICKPATLINRDDPWISPIHYASFGEEFNEWLSGNFFKAFGEFIIPNILHGSSIPLCIGQHVKLKGKFKNEQERLLKYASILENYKQAHLQGDGIKSFLGILLNLMLEFYQTFLIDEPESFLHPPQARIMGQIIGEALNDNQQAFISTHSEEIIKGVLDICPERLKIVRITRKDNKNNISILNNNEIESAFKNPLIKYSNIMSGIFHKNVVICESDSDCKFYSFIENKIKQKDNKYSESLFVHCGGKHRIGLIAKTLISLGIEVKLIMDLDFLDDINIVKNVTNVCGVSWNSIESDFNIIDKQVKTQKKNINKITLQEEISKILSTNKTKDFLSNSELEKIKKLLNKSSGWQQIKKSGVSALPAGDAKKAFNRINESLRAAHIYLVPVGELECFVSEIGGHGPDWVNTVIEKYPEISDPVYKNAIDFIQGMDL